MVPVEGSEKFVEKVQRSGKDKVWLYVKPGEHGFDGEVALDTPWLQEALQHVAEPWLGDR